MFNKYIQGGWIMKRTIVFCTCSIFIIAWVSQAAAYKFVVTAESYSTYALATCGHDSSDEHYGTLLAHAEAAETYSAEGYYDPPLFSEAHAFAQFAPNYTPSSLSATYYADQGYNSEYGIPSAWAKLDAILTFAIVKEATDTSPPVLNLKTSGDPSFSVSYNSSLNNYKLEVSYDENHSPGVGPGVGDANFYISEQGSFALTFAPAAPVPSSLLLLGSLLPLGAAYRYCQKKYL
jgi:hypothetical protein